jgi:hypothetical protein
MKIVLNKCYGGFSISRKAAEFMVERGSKQATEELADWKQRQGWLEYYKEHGTFPNVCPLLERGSLEISAKYDKEARFFGYGYSDNFTGYNRSDPDLVAAVEALGADANGEHASLRVVEIPDGIEWDIDNYDGVETAHELHRSW